MKNIMTRAWEIAREAVEKFEGKAVEYLSGALKMAWAELKKGVKKMKYNIEKLEEMGARKWEKGGHSRLYLNDAAKTLINLEVDYYNTGNIRAAKLNGEKVSNSACYKILAVTKAYIDLNTEKLVVSFYGGDRWGVTELLEEKLQEI